MSLLAFVLECAATAAVVGTGVCLLAAGTQLLLRPLSRHWRPARRADFVFVLGILPAVSAVAVVLAAAAPPIASAVGAAVDHCDLHEHHNHLCLVHSVGLRPVLATLGAFALAVFVFRSVALLRRVIDTGVQLRQLEKLGVRQDGAFPIFHVPGGPRLCHAVGIFRRRILISTELWSALSPDERSAALGHEQAHLRRRDSAALLVLSVAGLFGLPLASRLFHRQFQEAVEQACDADSAQGLASPAVVASALVKVASLQRSSAWSMVSAFGEHALEQRVLLLLSERACPTAPSRAIWLAGTVASTGLGLALLRADELHHAVETALHRFI